LPELKTFQKAATTVLSVKLKWYYALVFQTRVGKTYYEAGNWTDVVTVIPRVYWAIEIVDFSDYLPPAGEFKVRLYFIDYQSRLRGLRHDSPSRDRYRRNSAAPSLSLRRWMGNHRTAKRR